MQRVLSNLTSTRAGSVPFLRSGCHYVTGSHDNGTFEVQNDLTIDAAWRSTSWFVSICLAEYRSGFMNWFVPWKERGLKEAGLCSQFSVEAAPAVLFQDAQGFKVSTLSVFHLEVAELDLELLPSKCPRLSVRVVYGPDYTTRGKSKSPRSSKKKTASSRFISDEADESCVFRWNCRGFHVLKFDFFQRRWCASGISVGIPRYPFVLVLISRLVFYRSVASVVAAAYQEPNADPEETDKYVLLSARSVLSLHYFDVFRYEDDFINDG